MPSLYDFSNVGAMMNSDRNRASEIITLFGGVCCNPIAVRKNDNTTTIRMNDVVIIRIDGASDRMVNNATSCSARPDTVPPASPPDPPPRFSENVWARAGCVKRVSTAINSVIHAQAGIQ